jgi:hypothetical protein
MVISFQEVYEICMIFHNKFLDLKGHYIDAEKNPEEYQKRRKEAFDYAMSIASDRGYDLSMLDFNT